MKQKSISVFLPVLNEQENIKTCVQSAQRYLSRRFKDYEILVIDGGSTDNTEKEVIELAKKDKHITLVSHKKNLGYGAALRSGFARSSKELIFYTDSDNQFNIKDMDILLPMLSTFDIVAGFRINRQDPLMRIFIAWAYNLLIRILFNLKVKDIDASFKLYKKKVFKNMTLKANTGLIDAEVLIKAKKKRFRIGQIGVRHFPRLHGRTVYEVGSRNKIFAFVRPKVVLDIIMEIKSLWRELKTS